MTHIVHAECVGGPLDGRWADVFVSHGGVVYCGHRYRLDREDDGTFVLVYVGIAVHAA